MKLPVLFLAFAFCIHSLVFGFDIRIEGKFPGAEGQTIRLLEYADQISYRVQEITSAIVDENGHFALEFSRYEPQYVFFRVDHARMGFFVEPSQTYVLEFDPVNFDHLDDRRNPYLEPWFFSFSVVKPRDALHDHINAFEDVFHDFLLENFVLIHASRNRRIFDEFREHTDTLFGHIDNEYFQQYYRYKFAYYYRLANIDRWDNMLRQHLLNQPVQYQNTQYMNFFNTIFDTYVFAGSRNISNYDLRYTVNSLNSYHALMDSLGKDTILRNELLRELVMLKALQDMHDDPEYRRANVENILSYIKTEGKFPRHRVIAENILFAKNNLVEGAKAPRISLQDHNGDHISIPGDFKGKYVYLGFWASWCETCLLEFIALNELIEPYRDQFAVINISTDRHKSVYEAFLRAHNYPWKNFHFDHDFRLLDTYQVRNLPLFVLIDPQGNIVRYPARRPSNNLVKLFDWMLFQERRKSSQ